MREQTCFFTGHRDIPASELVRIRNNTYLLCRGMIEKLNISHFVCGGALGFDTLAAQVVLRLKEQYPAVRLHLVLPCKDQDKRWGASARETYRRIIASADSVEYISDAYTPYCMYTRNRRMADMSSYGIAFLRKATGGTAYTVRYAETQNVKMYYVDKVVRKEE